MRRLSLLALVVPLVLSSCSDDPGSDVADPPPPSSSPPSSEPTTSEPAEPTTSATPEPEPLGPEATVRAWVKARNKLLQTGDPGDVGALSSRDCSTCTELTDEIAEIVAAGGYFRTKGWSVNGARRAADFATSRVVKSALIFAEGVTLTAPGEDPVSYPEEKHFVDFTLSEDADGAWLVSRLVFLN